MIALLLIIAGAALIWLARPYSVDLFRYIAWRYANRQWLERGIAQSSDARITYRTINKPSATSANPPLILLHGGFGSYLDWYAQIPTLARSYALVLIDTRGHGRSTFGNRAFKYDLFANDVIAVLDKLKLSLVDVAGWSDGGITGLLLARDYPTRIRRLVAISVNAHADGLTDQARQLLDTDNNTGSVRSRLLRLVISPEPGRWHDLTQGLTDLWQDDPWLLDQQMRTIVTPTLIIAGANDDVHYRHLDDISSALPCATLHILPGIGHTVPQSAPAKVLQLMTEFLNTPATTVIA